VNYGCCENLHCNEGSGTCTPYSSPILIYLTSNSSNYELTSMNDGVLFDINADGDLEQVSWTEPTEDVAFLVLDRNGNGVVDSGAELFGDSTVKSSGARALNGFDALLDLDGGAGVSDGKIDARDAIYAQLRLWLDRNHNGISEPPELSTLQAAGVTTLFVEYRESPRVDRNGNSYRYVGEVLVRRNGRDTPRRIFDVILNSAF
jgi:hypothetical protein